VPHWLHTNGLLDGRVFGAMVGALEAMVGALEALVGLLLEAASEGLESSSITGAGADF
jgi:hypothetical protein